MPYELKMQNRIANNLGILYRVAIRTDGDIHLYVNMNTVVFTDSINEFKPILHPLSDLTKEIEHEGEKFVPLLELAAIATVSSSDCWTINNNKDAQHKTAKGYLFYINKSNSDLVLKKSDKWQDFDHVSSKLFIYQKLYEWHFDIFGLINTGLAIDINTIES